MKNTEKIFEIWYYLKNRKKWYLIPLIALLIILGSIMVLSEGSAVAPFIYAIF